MTGFGYRESHLMLGGIWHGLVYDHKQYMYGNVRGELKRVPLAARLRDGEPREALAIAAYDEAVRFWRLERAGFVDRAHRFVRVGRLPLEPPFRDPVRVVAVRGGRVHKPADDVLDKLGK